MSGKNVIPSTQAELVQALSTLEHQAIIRPNNPPPGIAGYLFDLVGDERLELRAAITDNYVEDNTAIQDQIALEPERFTVRGIVAELSSSTLPPQLFNPPADCLPVNIAMVPPPTEGGLVAQLKSIVTGNLQRGALNVLAGINPKDALKGAAAGVKQAVVSGVTNKVAGIAQSAVRTLLDPANTEGLLTPVPLTALGQTAVNILKNIVPQKFQAIISAVKFPGAAPSLGTLSAPLTSTNPDINSLYGAYQAKQPTSPRQTRQTSAVLYFVGLYRARQLFSVETPWGIFTDMVIEVLRAEQPETSRGETEFNVTFKKIRTAQAVNVTVGQLAGRLVAQSGADTPTQNGNLGIKTPTNAQQRSWLKQMGLTGIPAWLGGDAP